MSEQLAVESTAEFSRCRRYRYTLVRQWAAGLTVAFIGLNPSTADEHADDPTIRRCIGFARRWGYGRLVMLNLYAWRSTDPKALWRVDRPESEPAMLYDRNLSAIANASAAAARVVCAWGANPGPNVARPSDVLAALWEVEPVALALTKHGLPRHPLYVKSSAEPIPYPPTVS